MHACVRWCEALWTAHSYAVRANVWNVAVCASNWFLGSWRLGNPTHMTSRAQAPGLAFSRCVLREATRPLASSPPLLANDRGQDMQGK